MTAQLEDGDKSEARSAAQQGPAEDVKRRFREALRRSRRTAGVTCPARAGATASRRPQRRGRPADVPPHGG